MKYFYFVGDTTKSGLRTEPDANSIGGKIMKRIFVLLVVIFAVASISQAVTVVFNDPNLKAAVEAKLGITDPNATEMLKLTSFDANSKGIFDLNGLEYATNLIYLYLYHNNISDMNVVAHLNKLRKLDLRYNHISNYKAVSGLNAITYLNLGYNESNDMTAFGGLTTLTYLGFGGNGVEDINRSIISGLVNLGTLYLSDNFLTGSDLCNLVDANDTLTDLYLANNDIEDTNALAGFPNLKYLDLQYNDISDINPLAGLTSLTDLYLSVNNITSDDAFDLYVLWYLTNLVDLRLASNNISDITVLAYLPQIQQLRLRNNQIQDIFPLTYLYDLTRLDLTNNPLSFESWCIYLKQIINNKPSANITSNPLINDRFTDMNDMRIFAGEWLRQDCSNFDCSGADFGESGKVDFLDFAIFANWWMYQP